MVFHIFSIFPESFESYFNTSIIKRARTKKLIEIKTYDIRKFAKDKHRATDDRPFGGGAGMVMKVEPIIRGVSGALKKIKNKKYKIIILSAKGKQFSQKIACDLSKKNRDIILICGRYEGIDERVRKILKAQEISVGPYVLTDGEIAAMAVVSAVSRLVPGAIRAESLEEESHWSQIIKKEKSGFLEYPHYTRPETFEFGGKKYKVPKVLLSGDHKKISAWRRKYSKVCSG